MIADGTKVHWHGPATRQGRVTYTGTVLGFVPAMASLLMWEARFVQRRQRAIFWAGTTIGKVSAVVGRNERRGLIVRQGMHVAMTDAGRSAVETTTNMRVQ